MILIRLKWVTLKVSGMVKPGTYFLSLHKSQDYLGRSQLLVGVASGHDYPGKSRLKTAPTIYNSAMDQW